MIRCRARTINVSPIFSESQDVSQMKSRKKLVLVETSIVPSVKRELTPGKVKVGF